MSTFQILMFAATLFFAYQIYRHVQTLEDDGTNAPVQSASSEETGRVDDLIDAADEAYAADEIDQAKRLLEEALSKAPGNPEIMNKLAFVTARRGDEREAIALYERSLEIDENDDLTHSALASLYRSQRAFERAQDHYLKALAIDDSYAQTYYNYANLLVDMHENDQAARMYRRALELQSDFPQAADALRDLERRS
ncbi:MAG: tetratricopeptide repeat protein [Sulfuricurvum sp.]